MRALVTGAAGFVGSEIVHQLLAKGYDVVATARNVGDEKSGSGGGRCSHLVALASVLPGTLELKAADLLKEGSFDEACRGCDFIFHVASPFILAASDPQRELLDPALCGTVNLLNSAARESERRAKEQKEENARRPLRVVLTSSVAAVHGEYAALPRGGAELYSEEDWNATSSVANGQSYHLSKVMAEREAWKVAEAKKIDLVTVCPNFVLGPALSSAADGGGSISVGYVKGMVEGKAASGSPIICDVRDVARAHVVAAENPEAKGRYIVSQPGAVLPETMAEAIKSTVLDAGFEKEAALLPPAEAAPAGETGKARIDASRTINELGVFLRSPRETLKDAARSLIKLGVAVPASKVVSKG